MMPEDVQVEHIYAFHGVKGHIAVRAVHELDEKEHIWLIMDMMGIGHSARPHELSPIESAGPLFDIETIEECSS